MISRRGVYSEFLSINSDTDTTSITPSLQTQAFSVIQMESDNSTFPSYNYKTRTGQLSTSSFDKICRACLSSSCKEITCMFDVTFKDVSMHEIFEDCLALQVEQDDSLPKNLCKSCITVLIEIYKFKLNCKQSDEALRNILDRKSDIEVQITNNQQTEPDITRDQTILESPETKLSLEKGKQSKSNRSECAIEQLYDDDNIEYPCNRCNQTFDTYADLREHQKQERHPRPRNYRCPECHKPFSFSHLKQHMRTHTKEKPFACEICQMQFSLNCNLRRHMMIHTGERPYKCDVCNKGFIQARTLVEHKLTHTGETPFICSYCGLKFARAASHKAHLKRHLIEKGESRKILYNNECDICNRSFASKAVLKTHMLIHGEKTFLCSHCGKGFTANSGLLSHLRVHTGAKPYPCTVCNKAFSQIGSLKSHMLIHTGEKPFTCKLCSKAFTQRNHLKYHMRTHSGERPYICSYCGKAFALNGTLTVHIRTHTGETPYVCNICEKGFYDSSSMKKHKKGHSAVIVKNIDENYVS